MNKITFALLSLFLCWTAFAVVVNDITQLNPIEMEQIYTPKTIGEVQQIIKNSNGPVSIGGGRYSMGGQTAIDKGVQIDMRQMNKVVALDTVNKKITVQGGIRWRDIQDAIDPHNLSIKIMQTYSNFTVGGSLSVNVHGRYIGQGPLIRSVDSIKIVLANGELVIASPTQNSEIFYGAIGGYGGIGVIVEATLQLTDNIKLIRQVEELKTSEYLDYFKNKVRDNPDMVLHNGDIYPPHFESLRAINWKKTDESLTITERLIPRNQEYWFQPKALSIIASIPMGKAIRSKLVDPLLYNKKLVVWKNYEASYDVAELEPATRDKTTYVLQEYFIPVERFNEFIPKMRKVFNDYNVNVINVSIRHALPDIGSILAWAPEEVFCFVVYIRQKVTPTAQKETGEWTRAMVEQILSLGGRWYLPYQIHATDDQFQQAYSRYMEYYMLKKKVDPDYRLQNKLIERYYSPLPTKIRETIAKTPSYYRGEEQSFLALPEWYIVFNSDEYAAHMSQALPSDFPYWQSTKEFWSLYSKMVNYTEKKYPSNFGYKAMLWVIGGSYGIELCLKGLYENTIGWLSEATMSKNGTQEDKLIASYHKAYGDFVHVRPWFEFSFWDQVKDLWSKTSLFGENFIRKSERKLWFTLEFSLKTIYGKLIGWGSSTAYGAEPEGIYMVVEGAEILKVPGIKNIVTENETHLVLAPRYDVLRDLLMKLDGDKIRIIEIAGNRHILFTVLGPKGVRPSALEHNIINDSAIVTKTDNERLLVVTPVSSLVKYLKTLVTAGYEIEHVFDY